MEYDDNMMSEDFMIIWRRLKDFEKVLAEPSSVYLKGESGHVVVK